MSRALQDQEAFLVIYSHHGVRDIQVFYDYIPHSVRVERLIGSLHPVERIIELPPRFYGKPVDEVRKAWQTNSLFDKEPTALSKEEIAAKMAKRLMILDGIIRTSNQEGEIMAAKKLFKEYTGREWMS